jgi:hypothetical protein
VVKHALLKGIEWTRPKDEFQQRHAPDRQ